jgi:hypothetical protein
MVPTDVVLLESGNGMSSGAAAIDVCDCEIESALDSGSAICDSGTVTAFCSLERESTLTAALASSVLASVAMDVAFDRGRGM